MYLLQERDLITKKFESKLKGNKISSVMSSDDFLLIAKAWAILGLFLKISKKFVWLPVHTIKIFYVTEIFKKYLSNNLKKA